MFQGAGGGLEPGAGGAVEGTRTGGPGSLLEGGGRGPYVGADGGRRGGGGTRTLGA
ncbi:hypothetical protein OG473_38315 [Streptomyces anulatus]|uniref:hypothetical protein n=1 Tax=Streptomyces anulatus TaxID=1892 RepID=UPI0032494292